MYSSGIIDFATVIIMLIVIYEDFFGDQHREVKTSLRGIEYYLNLYSVQAQSFIFDNLRAIIDHHYDRSRAIGSSNGLEEII